MPATIRSKRTASRVRKNSVARKSQKRAGRQGRNGQSSATPSIVADSLFALKVRPVPGVVAQCGLSEYGVYEDMYNDILKCYKKIEATPRIPDASLPIADRLNMLMKRIRATLPSNLEFNIETKDYVFILAIYQRCEYVNYLPGFEVGHTLNALKKEYPRLHDLFLDFLTTFFHEIKVDTWFIYPYDACVDGLDDMVHWEAPDHDPEVIEEMKQDIEIYRAGAAAIAAKKLSRKKYPSTKVIMNRLNRLKIKHTLRPLIEKGCQLMDENLNMFSFSYLPDGQQDDDSGFEPIRFSSQAIIGWDFNDHVSAEYDSFIEMQSNEAGIDIPIYVSYITPRGNEQFDLSEFNRKCGWPMRLVRVLQTGIDCLKKYRNHERANKRIEQIISA